MKCSFVMPLRGASSVDRGKSGRCVLTCLGPKSSAIQPRTEIHESMSYYAVARNSRLPSENEPCFVQQPANR